MKQIIFLLFTSIILSSCASIFNLETTKVKISADKKSKIVFNNDTIFINRKQTIIRPKRSKKPLKIIVLKDSLKKVFSFKRKLSPVFYQNISNYGIGFLVDLTNNKRFTYKKNLHFVTDSINNKIALGNKKLAFIPKKRLFIYTSPLKLVDFTSIPMTTLGLEYFIKKNISLSTEYGTLLPGVKLNNHTVSFLEEKASTLRFESKWYNGINFKGNVHLNEYIGLEFRDIKSQYNSYINYYENNNSNLNNLTRDDFATKKRVTVINFKYGVLFPIGKRVYADFYTGLGLRIRRFNYLNLEYDSSIHKIESDDFFSFNLRDFEDYNKRILPNLSLGFKFGIKL